MYRCTGWQAGGWARGKEERKIPRSTGGREIREIKQRAVALACGVVTGYRC